MRTGVIHVVTAVITAQGENMISIAEETATFPAPATEGQPKASKKGRVAPQGANGAKKKGKSAKKMPQAKKAPKAAAKARGAHGRRQGEGGSRGQ
jgi:hypothetical protein